MPHAWLADGGIKVSIVTPAEAKCEIEIVSDLGKTYRSAHTISVPPHVIPPFLTGLVSRIHAAIFSFCSVVHRLRRTSPVSNSTCRYSLDISLSSSLCVWLRDLIGIEDDVIDFFHDVILF